MDKRNNRAHSIAAAKITHRWPVKNATQKPFHSLKAQPDVLINIENRKCVCVCVLSVSIYGETELVIKSIVGYRVYTSFDTKTGEKS